MNNENARIIGHAEDCLYEVLNSLEKEDPRKEEVSVAINILEKLGYIFTEGNE